MVSPPVYANDTKLGGCCVIREPLALSYSSLYRKEKKRRRWREGSSCADLSHSCCCVCCCLYGAAHLPRAHNHKNAAGPERARARAHHAELAAARLRLVSFSFFFLCLYTTAYSSLFFRKKYIIIRGHRHIEASTALNNKCIFIHFQSSFSFPFPPCLLFPDLSRCMHHTSTFGGVVFSNLQHTGDQAPKMLYPRFLFGFLDTFKRYEFSYIIIRGKGRFSVSNRCVDLYEVRGGVVHKSKKVYNTSIISTWRISITYATSQRAREVWDGWPFGLLPNHHRFFFFSFFAFLDDIST